MDYLNRTKSSLTTYIETLQGRGCYSFLKVDALKALGTNEESFDRDVRRLVHKKRLVVIKPGFLIIIPIEYKSWGSIPPDWFIKDLMTYLNIPYYVGLLSAAALYGAAHQQPQQFQVITNKVVRRIHKGKANIWFFNKEHIKETPVDELQTQTGRMRVSTPEATALDLVKFYKRAGYLSNVATVLLELAEKLDPKTLIETAKLAHYEWPTIQRLGYLLSCKEIGGEHIVEPLAKWLKESQPRFVPLVSYKTYEDKHRDEQWRIYINESIEVDL